MESDGWMAGMLNPLLELPESEPKKNLDIGPAPVRFSLLARPADDIKGVTHSINPFAGLPTSTPPQPVH